VGGGVDAYIFTADDGKIAYETTDDPEEAAGAARAPTGYDQDGCDSDYLGATKVWEFHGTFSYYVDNEGQPRVTTATTRA
jgi:hypothetical protein